MSAAPRRVIAFHSVTDEHGDFSNFAPYPMAIDGLRWPTSEHYFRAQKMIDPKHRDATRRTKTSAEAAKQGRDRSKRIRRDWVSAKVEVMRRALDAKFRQHPSLSTS
ncbi:MAG: NADAR family protein [Deltaproteobacteria bacterium]|nr:NADAR family protein [Deltaproteobacteria bacterium]